MWHATAKLHSFDTLYVPNWESSSDRKAATISCRVSSCFEHEDKLLTKVLPQFSYFTLSETLVLSTKLHCVVSHKMPGPGLRRSSVRTCPLMQRDRSVVSIGYSGHSASISKCTTTIIGILSFLIKCQSYSEYNIRKLQVTVCVFV